MTKILDIGTQRQPFVLRIDGNDYNVAYPVTAVAELETRLGRSMRSFGDWLRISPAELPTALEVGLQRNHGQEAAALAATVCDTLEAEAIDPVIEAVCTATFPRAVERYQQAVAELQQRAADSLVAAAGTEAS